MPRTASRKDAERCFQNGWVGIAAAFDLADSREWRFSPDVQKRALGLLSELMTLFKNSEIMVNDRVAPIVAAKGDQAFQRFLHSFGHYTGKRPRKRRGSDVHANATSRRAVK